MSHDRGVAGSHSVPLSCHVLDRPNSTQNNRMPGFVNNVGGLMGRSAQRAWCTERTGRLARWEKNNRRKCLQMAGNPFRLLNGLAGRGRAASALAPKILLLPHWLAVTLGNTPQGRSRGPLAHAVPHRHSTAAGCFSLSAFRGPESLASSPINAPPA